MAEVKIGKMEALEIIITSLNKASDALDDGRFGDKYTAKQLINRACGIAIIMKEQTDA